MGENLTVARLLEAGFQEVACWTAKEQKLERPLGLPSKRGVYAFAMGEQVFYVGLASRSIKQRLGFYINPAATQKTNVRLNGIILGLIRQGDVVRILLAHPDDRDWNGLRLSGPEGLEAALIEDYYLPWNVRGAKRAISSGTTPQSRDDSPRRERGTIPRAIIDFVAANPKCTELHIAKAVFGPSAGQPRANPYCRRLIDDGRLERLPTRPATYVVRESLRRVKAY